MKLQIKDTKPQVGIFEIVENQWLTNAEDVQNVSESGDYFDGIDLHLHAYEIPKLVQFNSNISNETKEKFKSNKYAYLDYPRGRVDYNTKEKTYHIMADKKFFTVENIEKLTRLFYLPPYGTGKIVLEADSNHYGYDV